MPLPTKKVILRSLLVLSALTIFLFAHILWVTRPSKDFHADIQLGRIDFPTPLSDIQGSSAIAAIKAIDGISIARLNTDKTSLIYSYPTGQLKTDDISQQFKQNVDFPIIPFKADLNLAGSGCPVINKKSVTYRISMIFHNAFK